jgi:hypothetical protein
VIQKSENTEDRESQEEFLRPPIERKKSRWGFRGMTVRDWMPIVGALLIPIVIAVGTWVITLQQGNIEDRRAKAERELAEQRAQDDAVQAYLDQMNNLLLEHNLRHSEEDSRVRTLAQARTLTVLGRLDPSDKTAVMQFLVEADLLQRPLLCGEEGCGIDPYDPIIRPIIRLSNAELREADLREAGLIEADLSQAVLRGPT